MALTKNDKYIVTGSSDKSIRVFDLKEMIQVHCIEGAHEGNFGSF